MPKDVTDTQELKQEFWNRAESVTAGMLSAEGAPPRPMAHTAKPEDNALWFITANGTDIADAATQGKKSQFVLACAHGQIYAAVEGTLSLELSEEKIDEIWSPFAAVWFEDGREDEDVRLVRFTPHEAEIWATDGSAKSLYEMARAHITDERPDMGDHGTVRF